MLLVGVDPNGLARFQDCIGRKDETLIAVIGQDFPARDIGVGAALVGDLDVLVGFAARDATIVEKVGDDHLGHG